MQNEINFDEVKNFIVADKVSFSYESDEYSEETSASAELVMVLSDVSLTVKKGEFLSLIGHNGSGKSSLAKLMNGMQLPTGGRVFVKGIDTFDEDLKYEVRRTVGLILQNPDNQIVSTVVEEDIAFGPENLGIPPAEIRKRVDDALNTVGMYEYRKHEPHRLSGGQKQRVAIAGILAMEPECIVLDESTAMLDPSGRREVLDTIYKLNKEKGMTVVFITHNMEEAVLSDRVIVLEKGEIILEGTPREVFSKADKLRSVELDVPQPTELCDVLRKEGIPLPEGVLTVSECIKVLSALLAEKQLKN